MTRLSHIKRELVQLDSRRSATRLQRAQIAMRAKLQCEVEHKEDGTPCKAGETGARCNNKLKPGWTAGHFPVQWHHGGRTELDNLRAECNECAPKVGAMENRTAKKTNRMAGETGQVARRKKNGSKLKSKGFPGHRKFNGKIVWRESNDN